MDNYTLQEKLEQLRSGDKDALADIYEALKVPVHTIASPDKAPGAFFPLPVPNDLY